MVAPTALWASLLCTRVRHLYVGLGTMLKEGHVDPLGCGSPPVLEAACEGLRLNRALGCSKTPGSNGPVCERVCTRVFSVGGGGGGSTILRTQGVKRLPRG